MLRLSAVKHLTEMARPKSVGKFSDELDAYYKQALLSTVVSAERGKLRYLELHPSSFPYCGLRHLNSICEAQPGADRVMDFRMAVTVDVGTAYHSVIQQAMGVAGRLYGNWTCKCGNTTEFSNVNVCGKCEATMHYEELGVRIGKRICGHTDGLYRLKGTDKYVVIDYKTTRSSKIKSHISGKYKSFPDARNVSQIRSYCGLLNLQYGINVIGWALIYAGRDSLATDYVICDGYIDAEGMEDIHDQLADWDDQFDYVVKASTLADAKYLVDVKPCKTYESYMANYHDHYNPCALSGICFNKGYLKEHLTEQIAKAEGWLPLTYTSLNKAQRELEEATGIKYKN